MRRKRTKEQKNYSLVHQWLRYHHGKANKCEGKSCKGITQKYTWALIRGKKYEKKRENFMMLCRSCHALYDMSDDFKEKMREINIGKKLSRNHKRKIKKSMMGRPGANKKAVAQYTFDGELVGTYDSITAAAKAIGKSLFTVSNCLAGRHEYSGGYIWKFIQN